jgi:pimeloyl-ACP methyl ester carboxylesterase
MASGTVLIVHGWTGEASFMTAIAEAIRRSGFRVALFDLPAHGLSSGRSTNLIDCARATVAIADHVGPIHSVVTHSFGGLIALVAAEGHAPMPHAMPVERVVLIASPNRLTDVTDHFSRHWELSGAGRKAFEHRVERIGGRALDCFAAVKLLPASGARGLVIHAPDDIDVPFRCAEEIVARVGGMELLSFNGLGHRNILFAPPVMRAITSFLKRTVQQAMPRSYQAEEANAPTASL